MKSFLRTAPTRRLLAMCAGLVVAIAGGSAIAVAASSGGPVPPAKPLADAIHQALAAPAVTGVSARISFTNNLIDSTDIQGKDPLLQGASGRLWWSNDGRVRIELQSDNGDAQLVVNRRSFWVYDPTQNTVYEGALPAGSGKSAHAKDAGKTDKVPTVAQIQTRLNQLAQHWLVSGARPSDVAGQPAYTVRVSPKHDGGLLGAAELAWDSARGLPLRVAVYANGSNSPVLELKANDISYGSIPASDFIASPPAGAKVVKIASLAGGAHAARGHGARAKARAGHAKEITGVSAVARRLPFALNAPATLDDLPRQSVSLLDWAGSPAALVTYGQGLGGIAVIEQTAKAGHPLPSQGSSGDRPGLSLPTVSINGASGQELDTALGTMVRFSRGGVAYTVLGSVPPTAADAAARAL